jgi:hypothetical protein
MAATLERALEPRISRPFASVLLHEILRAARAAEAQLAEVRPQHVEERDPRRGEAVEHLTDFPLPPGLPGVERQVTRAGPRRRRPHLAVLLDRVHEMWEKKTQPTLHQGHRRAKAFPLAGQRRELRIGGIPRMSGAEEEEPTGVRLDSHYVGTGVYLRHLVVLRHGEDRPRERGRRSIVERRGPPGD